MRTAVLCALVPTLVAAVVTGTAAAAPPDVPVPIEGAKLGVDLTSRATAVAALESKLTGNRVTVREIATARDTRKCDTKGEVDAARALPDDVEEHCWHHIDATSKEWMPQGITSTADASPTNSYEGRQALAVTSYRKRGTKEQARVTLLPNFAHEGYKHILLVEATGKSTGKGWRSVDCHAGGAVWYGHHLLVACKDDIKVFDWRKVYKTDKDAPNATARLIMVQTGVVTRPQPLRFSSIALDRSGPSNLLVVSEYTEGRCGNTTCRVFRNVLPAELGGTALPAHDAYRMSFRMQGAVSRGDQFWFSTSDDTRPGTLRSWNSKSVASPKAHAWTVGSESVSYWDRGNGTGVLLTVTEHPKMRIIAAVESTHYPPR